MISGLNEQLQQELEYTLLKPDCHSWWISKMQSGREDTLEEWYANEFIPNNKKRLEIEPTSVLHRLSRFFQFSRKIRF